MIYVVFCYVGLLLVIMLSFMGNLSLSFSELSLLFFSDSEWFLEI